MSLEVFRNLTVCCNPHVRRFSHGSFTSFVGEDTCSDVVSVNLQTQCMQMLACQEEVDIPILCPSGVVVVPPAECDMIIEELQDSFRRSKHHHSLLVGNFSVLDETLVFCASPYLHYLRHIALCDCKQLTDIGIVQLAKAPRLETINLLRCEKITDVSVKALSMVTSLKTMILERCTLLTDDGLSNLSDLSNLQHLNLMDCTRYTDTALLHIAKCAKLESVILAGIPRITTEGVRCMLKKCTTVCMINIADCTNIANCEVNCLEAMAEERVTKLVSLGANGISIQKNSLPQSYAL